MIYVGIDDTDTIDHPGTNQLARHLIRELAAKYRAHTIVRHQLLEDPRVPCTSKNGCASILLEPLEPQANANHRGETPLSSPKVDPQLIDSLRLLMLAWCPNGSDPGLCVADRVPPSVVDWGQRCKRELVTQSDAYRIATEAGIYLEGLGGTQDGVIGALAAIGLVATKNDGRITYSGAAPQDWYEVTGRMAVDEIHAHGVDEIRRLDNGEIVTEATIIVAKRLRPNYRSGRKVLYITKDEQCEWVAARVV